MTPSPSFLVTSFDIKGLPFIFRFVYQVILTRPLFHVVKDVFHKDVSNGVLLRYLIVTQFVRNEIK